MKNQGAILRKYLTDPEILLCVGVALPMHARMAEANGFKCVQISGASASVEELGLPDAGLTTMTEVADNAARVVRACDIPVLVDCETGFGTPLNVRRTVATMIRTGAAGLFIEDQEFPPRCAMVAGARVAPIREAVARLRAAVDQRNEMDKDFLIIARTDCRGAANGTVKDVIERAKAYFDAGVDVVKAAGLRSREEIMEVREAVDGMLSHSCHLIRPYPTLDEMQEMGMCMTSGLNVFKCGFRAQWDMYAETAKRGTAPWAEYLDGYKRHPLGGYGTFDLTGLPRLVQMEEQYMSEEAFSLKYKDTNEDYNPNDEHAINGMKLAF